MADDWDWSRFAVGGATRPDTFSGMQPQLRTGLQQLFASAPPEIQANLRVMSGYRSPQRQAQLYADALQKYGSPEAARKWVAPPGNSQHNHGNASDLKFLNDQAREWVHANAANYGLAFPLSNENWHIEVAGARGHPKPTQIAAGSPPQAPGTPAPPMGPARDVSPMQVAGVQLGDFVAPQPAALDLPSIGSAIGDFLARRADQKRIEQETQAADQARKAALFGGDLGGLYA